MMMMITITTEKWLVDVKLKDVKDVKWSLLPRVKKW